MGGLSDGYLEHLVDLLKFTGNSLIILFNRVGSEIGLK